MKKYVLTTLMAALFISLSSFVQSIETEYSGVYGSSENDPTVIQLTLNKDKTFSYKDFSNPAKKINVTGNWALKNKHVHLIDFESEYSFHSKWKILNEGNVAKSRKGLTFYTLSKKCN